MNDVQYFEGEGKLSLCDNLIQDEFFGRKFYDKSENKVKKFKCKTVQLHIKSFKCGGQKSQCEAK